MTDLSFPLTQRNALPRLTILLTGFSAVLLALYLILGAADPRLLDGVGVWVKPAKFAASFVLFFGTLAWLEPRLSPAWRDGRTLRLTLWVMAAAYLSEMAYMSAMAAQAQHSHFNLSTPFHAFMYTVVMAAGAVSLVAGAAVYGVVAARDRAASLSPGLRLGVVTGFVLTFALTMIVAGYMSNAGGHFVGTPTPGAPVLPLVGWSAQVGDLRPAHFLSIHAMQALPLIGLAADRLVPDAARRWVVISALGYSALTLGIFAQALAGQPLLAL